MKNKLIRKSFQYSTLVIVISIIENTWNHIFSKENKFLNNECIRLTI